MKSNTLQINSSTVKVFIQEVISSTMSLNSTQNKPGRLLREVPTLSSSNYKNSTMKFQQTNVCLRSSDHGAVNGGIEMSLTSVMNQPGSATSVRGATNLPPLKWKRSGIWSLP